MRPARGEGADRRAGVRREPAHGGWPGRPARAVPEFLPGRARWTHSAAYDRHLTGSGYAGRFFLDPVTDRLYFDTVNPTPQPDNS